MRTARLLAIVLLLAAIVVALLFVFRLPLAGWAARTAMASAGLEQPQARVTALTINRARLEGVRAGSAQDPAFSFESIDADFHWRRLWSERKVDALRGGPGMIRLRVEETGRISLSGVTLAAGPSGSGGGGLPFDRLSLEDVALEINLPEGAARGALNAEYDIKEGGAALLDLASGGLVWNDMRLYEVASQIQLILSVDGRASLSAKADADLELAGVIARDVSLKVDGEGGLWRQAAQGGLDQLSGAARIDFAAPDISWRDPQDAAPTSVAQLETLLGAPLQSAGLTGALEAKFDATGIELRISDETTPLALTTRDGASLTLRPQGDAPVFASSGERKTTSFRFALKSEGVDAAGALDAEREDASWRLAAPIEIAEFTSQALVLDDSRVDVAAASDGNNVNADISVKSGLRKAVIGRLEISDAPFRGAFRINADVNARRATIASTSDCFAIDRGRGRIAEQELDIRLTEITLCNAEGPLAVYTWSGENACTISGELSARDGMLQFGETYARGRPPVLRFDASYHPARNTTSIRSDIANGAMTLNDVLDVAGVIGRFDVTLDADGLRADAAVDRLLLGQRRADSQELAVFAPVVASGEGALKGDDAVFSYALTTPEGFRLGAGVGSHDMKTARGETTLMIENLVFSPVGLQPNRISPALKGIVDAADGAMHGEVKFAWAPEALDSAADLVFDNISFGGPTRAVTRTHGVSGSVQLTDLLPLTTSGLQTITVKSVDMDALQLETGVISFAMPGDDTVILERGEFPWFGGTIGVYDATAGFAGEASIPLKAENIDLKQVFEYVKVDGLSGEGIMTGSMPLVFKDGKAFIENGTFESVGAGVLRYQGAATDQAASAGSGAKVAFDILKDLRFRSMKVVVNGPLDGRLDFQVVFVGTGEVTVPQQGLTPQSKGRVPVLYKITLDAALLELLRQAVLSTDVKLQIQQSISGGE